MEAVATAVGPPVAGWLAPSVVGGNGSTSADAGAAASAVICSGDAIGVSSASDSLAARRGSSVTACGSAAGEDTSASVVRGEGVSKAPEDVSSVAGVRNAASVSVNSSITTGQSDWGVISRV